MSSINQNQPRYLEHTNSSLLHSKREEDQAKAKRYDSPTRVYSGKPHTKHTVVISNKLSYSPQKSKISSTADVSTPTTTAEKIVQILPSVSTPTSNSISSSSKPPSPVPGETENFGFQSVSLDKVSPMILDVQLALEDLGCIIDNIRGEASTGSGEIQGDNYCDQALEQLSQLEELLTVIPQHTEEENTQPGALTINIIPPTPTANRVQPAPSPAPKVLSQAAAPKAKNEYRYRGPLVGFMRP